MEKPRVLWLTVAVLLIAIASVAVFKVWPLLHPKVLATAPLDPSCDLRVGPCTGLLPGGGRVRFAVEPSAIPVVEPLRLQVWTEDLDVSLVEVDFSGVDMNMGFNRPRLERVAPGRFAGEGMLPVCVRARMSWEARVLLHTPGGLQAVPFRFDTFQPGMGPGT